VHAFFEDSIANGLTILPPDVNLSSHRFVPVDGKTIRYGLGAVKGTGEAAIAAIINARNQGGPYTDLFDFCRRADKRIVNRRVVESLIRAGAFDSVNHHRASLLASVGIALEAAEQAGRAVNQVSLFGEGDDPMEQPRLISVPLWVDRERLKNEKMALGFYLSGHPFNDYAADLKDFVRTRLNRLNPQREPQLLAGIIYAMRTQMTRRGKMGVIVLDDGTARVEIVVFSELFESFRGRLKEDQLLLVEARVSTRRGDDENGDELRISADQIYNLDDARSRYAKRMELYCNGQSNAIKLKELLSPYRSGTHAGQGDKDRRNNDYCPVSVFYRNQVGICELELGEAWRVSLQDNLLQSLFAHLKTENVKVVY
jgi:DNA polymerase III subunit alpha